MSCQNCLDSQGLNLFHRTMIGFKVCDLGRSGKKSVPHDGIPGKKNATVLLQVANAAVGVTRHRNYAEPQVVKFQNITVFYRAVQVHRGFHRIPEGGLSRWRQVKIVFQLVELPQPLPIRIGQFPTVSLMAVNQSTAAANTVHTADVVPVSMGQQSNVLPAIRQAAHLGISPTASEPRVDPHVVMLRL